MGGDLPCDDRACSICYNETHGHSNGPHHRHSPRPAGFFLSIRAGFRSIQLSRRLASWPARRRKIAASRGYFWLGFVLILMIVAGSIFFFTGMHVPLVFASTPTASLERTAAGVPAETQTDTPAVTSTTVPTDIPVLISTPLPTFTRTSVPGQAFYPTDTLWPTWTASKTPAATSTPLPTSTPTITSTRLPTQTLIPTDTHWPTWTASITPAATPTPPPPPTPTRTSTRIPTQTPIPTDTRWPTPLPAGIQ